METKTQECEKSKRVFETIITLLGQKAEISHKYTGKNIVLNVTSEDPGRLIGRRGIALNSITHLMNLVLKREDSDHPHVVIDVKGLGEEKGERGNRRDKRRNNNRNDKRRNDKRNNNSTEAKEAPAKEEAPVAEEEGIRLGIHPDDPPVDEVGGVPRIMTNFEAFKRLIEIYPSDHNAIEFCQGTFSEMDEDIYEMIEYFASRNKILYVQNFFALTTVSIEISVITL